MYPGGWLGHTAGGGFRQSENLADGVVATGKHFLGFGFSEGGLNMTSNPIPSRELREVYAKPFQAAISQADLGAIMNSYGVIDGQLIVGAKEILIDLLRNEMGFEGIVVSDYMSIEHLIDRRVAPDMDAAALYALQAGLDLECPVPNGYSTERLVKAVDDGFLDEALIDRSALRVMETKIRLDLPENPKPRKTLFESAYRNPMALEHSLKAAREATVLLKNDGLLPLSKTLHRIAVIGPHADSIRLLFGGYTFPAGMEMALGRSMGEMAGMSQDFITIQDDDDFTPMEPFPDSTVIADAEQLTPYMKRRINVTGRCDYNCAYREKCRHRWHIKQMKSNTFDFQICNHQLLLADTFHRRDGHTPLIPHYQAVIIDEGHKFLAAARQMYGVELAGTDILPVTEDIRGLSFKSNEGGAKVCRDAKKLCGQAKRLTKLLLTNVDMEGADEASDRISVALDATAVRHLRNIRSISAELLTSLSEEQVAPRQTGRRAHILWELEGIGQRAGALEKHGNLICWQEKRGDDVALCAIPNNLDELLYQHFWSKGIPVVLTSGTLSAGDDFSHIKRALGLHRLVPSYLMETTQPSPFDHNANTLLYISKGMPFPDNRSREYLAVITDEIERLLKAAHGHAAVLFTSYKAMDIVCEMLEGRNLPYPIFQLNRGKTAAIGQFRESDGGVLLASGALWEGINIPGDALSLLVIVRLPFAVPDPVSEYEQTLYPSMAAFKDSVVVPDMLVKLKQGAGRLIRTETDTGVIAILDSRAQEGSQYHNRILRALPTCRVTTDIAGVRRFIRSKKKHAIFCEV
ncbi:glycoside hydrolase family 3 C-terminal domain-containing protein [Ruminococcaceae bacterium OttesenSCG-928-D13]|nr:glycoside hydrolase family 3 C-terminal domain-containing protein [Ruminococcaceae bacterium OttesenSCG-928-D13]